jgi:hypothetical protein
MGIVELARMIGERIHLPKDPKELKLYQDWEAYKKQLDAYADIADAYDNVRPKAMSFKVYREWISTNGAPQEPYMQSLQLTPRR